MLRTRVIPCLLLRHAGLVKTVRFGDPSYVGDPINAVRIFNDKEVDELAFLDIAATPEGRGPAFDTIERIASECFMPLCYGGGVGSLADMRRLFNLGVEKVAVNTCAVRDPDLIKAAAREFGNQSVVVAIDARRGLFGRYDVVTDGGRSSTGFEPGAHAAAAEELGAGEILLNAVHRDGTMRGYDLKLIRMVTAATSIPVIACGGAGSVADLAAAVNEGGASAVAAGSLFVYYGPHRAVLINYPTAADLSRALGDGSPSPFPGRDPARAHAGVQVEA